MFVGETISLPRAIDDCGRERRPLSTTSWSPCLAAARSRSGSESRLGFHSIPSRRYATREWEANGTPRRRPLQGKINSVRRRDFVRKWG